MLQRLEAEGIRAYLQDEHTVTIDPILSNAIGGIKLMVFADQVPRAQELLQEFEQVYIKAIACPECGSHNVLFVSQPRNAVNWLSALASWFLGNYAVSIKQVYRCFDCDNEFEEIPDNNPDA
jgi:DNA-directed RNA polymerase subunit RPC12/RpoP